MDKQKYYICIDLKSFFASVECVERGLDPLNTNLVVADNSRTEKTICLAVTPSLKSYGISGRARLFEVVSKVKQINEARRKNINYAAFSGESFLNSDLERNPYFSLGYIVAPPRMAYYMEYSTRVYKVYLKYVAPEDIHVYSIDEVFIDVTSYLKTYNLSAKELAIKIINDVFETTGITATAGVGTNMYLAKVAMDIVAKKARPDKNGARISELNEHTYRAQLWSHRPITDFWRVGSGTAKRLESVGIYTMGDIAKCSVGGPGDYYNEDVLYRLLGVNAELLIDHAWGWEPCTMEDIRNYKPVAKSISSGQVLHCPYDFNKTKLIVREMTELMVLDLVEQGYVTNQIVLTVGYDISNLTEPKIRDKYKGEITKDHYGRRVPKHAHGTGNLKKHTSSTKQIMECVMELFDRIVNKDLLTRRINLSANNIQREDMIKEESPYIQLDFFSDFTDQKTNAQKEDIELKKEKEIQRAMISIKKRYGKNAVLKGINLEEGATTMSRNEQIGGHKA